MLRRALAPLLLAAVLGTTTVALALTAPPTALAPALSDAHDEARAVLSVGQRIGMHLHDVEHPLRSVEPIGDPVAAALVRLKDEPAQGRVPADWVLSARADRFLALEAGADGAPADLVAEVARLHALVGHETTADERAAVAAQADALPADVRAALADLVRATADAYAAQLPVAQDVLARWPPAEAEETLFVSHAQRDAMAANADALVGAMNRFAALAPSFGATPASSVPLFRDPLGLVVVGGAGADTFVADGRFGDPVLLVDLGGDDAYFTSAGGACPDALSLLHACNGLAVSAVLDLAGHDLYFYDGVPAGVQGAGTLGGLGILADLAGNDQYFSTMRRATSGPFGFPTGYVDGGAQGFGEAGYGLLLDAAGHDVYRADVESTHGRSIWNFAQGFGSLGGLGIAADAQGDDQWLSNGLGIPKSNGFQGVYAAGVGFYGGVGVLTETGMGRDVYRSYNNGTTVDYYSIGFAAFGGVGVFFEDGGDDDYVAVEIAYDPFIVPLLNCAYGTASFGGVGVFLEMGGNDRYYGDTRSPRAAATMNEGFGGPGAAYGLFVDVSGDDGHFMEVHGGSGRSFTAGRGVLVTNGNLVGNYLDLGGNDAYTGAAPSRDDGVWTGGADINAPFALFG